MKRKRIEYDSLGPKKIEKDSLWGAQTQRSLENFKIGSEKIPKEIIVSFGYQKKAAALANIKLGQLNNKIGKLIVKACDQIINMKLLKEFPLSIWQTGSGTQTNMNANEVISNYAIKLLKGKIGSKHPIHPNDHVNLSQSSNDTFPTVMNIACNELIEKKLLISLDLLINELKNKSKKFHKTIKIGRTHLQDATPITLGQEFSGYLQQIINNKERILSAKKELIYLAQGGTAVGTGLNAPKNFDKVFCQYLSKITKTKYLPAKNKFESIAAHDSMVNLSASLNSLSVSLMKIANDIRLLSSGPRSGIGELHLPINEPGSSIMPGKVNPTQIEALTMVCAQVMGNHSTISISGSQGHFELNTFKPVIIYNNLQSINLLSDSINSFNKKCLKNIKINKKQIEIHLRNSLMLVTALNKYIGYDKAAEIAKKAYKENITLKEAAVSLKIISPKKFDEIVQPKKMI
ncbi:MAG: Fumarate hydratase class II [Alphaproteobacteria bacterium MarineAlpha5_Bin8]|nr:MAG: Fumarate hydratase class II [Alphaproteobacteria bacterium MarineAlpha5_Bin7]PPR48245.1 MAG: Fumarate hydratase class II [Alphaproteobacteria bacterium MarineAlpha5_Bin8]PPR54451.1 MAG: Fumarate hydratase class II [Alphaproteobacteria bacterium MarineAlpha5_Bin6]|tara:strand:- start:6458 stop:7840 length:1383 start_codon:yes stop_codon:yes gene_type:complete